MSKKSREDRVEWLRQGRCFSCGSPLDNTPSRYYCIRHWIRYALRKKNLFYTKTAYTLPSRSRVRLERISKRRFIVNHLRARFIAVSRGHVDKFQHIREALLFLDEMWTTLHLHHSFPLRNARLGALVQFLLKMDGYASGGRTPRKGWRGDFANRKTGPRRRHDGPRNGNSVKTLDTHNDPPLGHA